MIDLTTLKEISFNGLQVEKIQGATTGVIWQKESDFTRMAIHSEDEQYIYTGVMNSGDLILEGRFRLNYIDPPTANGDGNWVIGGRQTGSQTLGIFCGMSGLFVSYGGATSAQIPNLIVDTWYTYYMDINGISFTTDDGVVRNLKYPSGGKLIPVENQVEIGICNITYGYSGGLAEKRRMWGDHDYHKCTDRNTGEVLYNFEAGVDKNGIACFKDTVTDELRYSESSKDFTSTSEMLVNSRTMLSNLGIEPTIDYERNKEMLNGMEIA